MVALTLEALGPGGEELAGQPLDLAGWL
jgi:hypothetical protein